MTRARPYGAPADQRPGPPPPAIALVGPPGGGKTTFLQGILKGTPDRDRYGRWRVVVDENEADLAGTLLGNIDRNTFPVATSKVAEETWTIRGTWPARPRNSLFGRQRFDGGEAEEFDLRICDLPGGSTVTPQRDDIAGLLGSVGGIILLVDPVRMMAATHDDRGEPPVSTYGHLHRLLRALDSRLAPGSSQVPQVLSVCVGKLDHPDVFRLALDRQALFSDDGKAPVVPPGEHSRQLFEHLCRTSVDPADADIPDLLDTYFARIDYHTVSSIGLYVGPDGYDQGDTLNVVPSGGTERIRRYVPMQVWETLLDLYLLLPGVRP
ncbi:hypothetical protein [Paractinoplanes maris]|uniref:hypothetical protein n=1 Tax=Paractinoplanes maris TaxID=1734446 RepID=UPI0020200290|nr:hypothetical protein [Actinoplanes maris]